MYFTDYKMLYYTFFLCLGIVLSGCEGPSKNEVEQIIKNDNRNLAEVVNFTYHVSSTPILPYESMLCWEATIKYSTTVKVVLTKAAGQIMDRSIYKEGEPGVHQLPDVHGKYPSWENLNGTVYRPGDTEQVTGCKKLVKN